MIGYDESVHCKSFNAKLFQKNLAIQGLVFRITLVDSKWIISQNLQDFLQSSLTKNVFSSRTCKGNLQKYAK